MRTIGIIVCSDKCFKMEREDLSGKKIAEITTQKGYKLLELIIVPDEVDKISNAIIHLSDIIKCDLILTTGGTGFAFRDVTPEATNAVIERQAPGISEAIRMKGLAITDRAMLSRGVSGTRNKSLIVNLAGSVKAVTEGLEIILPAITHGLDILNGEAIECGKAPK